MAPHQKPAVFRYAGCLSYLLLPIGLIGAGFYGHYLRERDALHEAKLKSAQAKGMELCQKWSETYPPFVNKPGLFQYSRVDSNDERIPVESIYLSDPEELPESQPSAKCVPVGSEKRWGVVRGLLVPAKYRSESWPYCHRGYRLNPDYDPAERFSSEYISCVSDDDLILGKYWRYETGKVWVFDLEGNLLPEE